MSLKIVFDAEQQWDAEWFHIGHDPGGRLIGWRDGEEEEFRWLRDVKAEGRLLVAPAGNPEYQNVRDKAVRRQRRWRLDDGSLPSHIERKVLAESMAYGLLKGWEGVDLGAGDEGPYKPSRGQEVLEKSGTFRELVANLALTLSDERKGQLNEDANALGNGSGGSSGGETSSGASSATE